MLQLGSVAAAGKKFESRPSEVEQWRSPRSVDGGSVVEDLEILAVFGFLHNAEFEASDDFVVVAVCTNDPPRRISTQAASYHPSEGKAWMLLQELKLRHRS